MVFEITNRTFGSIASVNSSGCELKIYSFVQHVLLEGSGSLVVKSLEFGSQATQC